ncbi:TetR/AcrR family transcriptional regulator [Phaeobacter gallaeciensis]|jgi:AcrR family transcriptional regulator|uniref:TetR/AcrR family transcriptional regulator n=1 Tax=Phaeobacter gallaeciensis TaxID=60890 RepID=A0ABD4XEF7_9RHOB|nr:TetR/AcrR family transcriptional regulator [Phaeobacter gallaeciensis]MDE4142236.1 TetR/AcrR family transcriptional regulator [Phaeobacter gallaeciensis]MDE4146568.1 TetR/AcrR family transcriptional regulator [Phaeobacter gallaeciensis]MDE4150641.1 TetR/AcrR family transcriptional regulator [Phaeobacter gallaeciensis]MDE4154820.1 TetR/AcrR family transcriptional regulator [Phaeobacter gallaeciensis]MDE4159290.1 TetR/AcrR family transcriptional regulator [Phaeobacter gallaeciensis]
MKNEQHEAVGGRVNLYRRKNSRFWQCQGSFDGKSKRASTKTESLDEARRFAENWYLQNEKNRADADAIAPVSRANNLRGTPGTVSFPLHDKKSRLLAAAIELVSEIGFKDAQISLIAERAGLAQGTLYRNYKSRTALLVKVVSHVSQHEVDVVAGIAMGDEPAPEILRHCAYTFGSRAIRGRQLGYALVAEPVESEIEVERLRYRQKLMRVFETVIERGIREGAFVDQPVQVSSACIVGSLFEALVGPIARVNDTSEADQLAQVEAIADFCVRAVVGVASA